MSQVQSGNFPIPNDTGANVLADINENIRANATNNSGANTPPITLAHQFFVDESTTPDELKIRDASNASYITLGKLEQDLGHMPKTGGTFTGNLSIPSGSATTPSLQINDNDTGLFLFAANDLGITTGGTLRVNINSNGLTINEGKELRFKDPQNNNYVAVKAPALSSDITFTLPDSDGNAGDKLESDGNGGLSWQPVQGVPTGSVHVMATTTVPSGYLECNGSYVSRTTYAGLFAVIGTTWGTSSSSDFRLPDLRGQIIRGWSNTGTTDSGRTFASSQTSQNISHNHTITSTVNDSGHNHSISYAVRNYYQEPNNMGVGTDASANSSDNTSSATTGITVTSTAANDGGTEARPINIAMMYVIKS